MKHFACCTWNNCKLFSLLKPAKQREALCTHLIAANKKYTIQVVTAEYDLKPISGDVISTYFSPFSIKKSKVWCVCVKAAITFRSSRLHKFALLSLSLDFTHNFRTALETERRELIYQNDFQCLFSFNVFFWGFSSWLTWDLFPPGACVVVPALLLQQVHI